MNDRYKEFNANYVKIKRLSKTIEGLEKMIQINEEINSSKEN